MKRKHLLSIVIPVLIIMLFSIKIYDKNQSLEVMSEVGFRNISYNIIQLEGAITFQMDNNWSEPSNVIEKVEDVIEGVYITRKIGNELNVLSSEDDIFLSRLYEYFDKLPEYSGFPNHQINENQMELFEVLNKKLRDIGWGYNISYSSSWDELIEKANNLMTK